MLRALLVVLPVLLGAAACSQGGAGAAAAKAAPGQSAAAASQQTGASAAAPVAQSAAAAPAEAPDRRAPLLDDAFVRRVCDEAVAALAEGADIHLVEPVPALLLTVEQARARRRTFAHELPENAGITAAMDLAADFVFSDTMLGRYLPDEKVLYVIDEVLESASGGSRERAKELLFGVMAHELVHAHDDQVYHAMPSPGSLAEIVADGSRLPQMQAQMSLLEGHAVFAAELACRHAGRQPLPAFTLEDAREAQVLDAGDRGLAARLGVGLVNGVARAKLVQYAFGREFCRRAHAFGGERFIGQAFASLPLSLSELEDFELFRQRWAADMERAQEGTASEGGGQPAGGR